MTTHKEINNKYKQIESDISFFFSNEKKKKQIKEHLKDKTQLFWDSINLINTLSQIDTQGKLGANLKKSTSFQCQ